MHKQDSIKQKPQYTRKISPKLGLLGFFGLFGFLGFVPQFFGESGVLDVPFPLIFFCFFGFFGFYYEGKMSGIMIDERYEANVNRAAAIANRVYFSLCFHVQSSQYLLRAGIHSFAYWVHYTLMRIFPQYFSGILSPE